MIFDHRANVFRNSTLEYSPEKHRTMSAGYQGGQKVQKVMVQPINLIFRYLQNRTRVSVWLYENVNTRCSKFKPSGKILVLGLRVTSPGLTST